MADIGEKLLNLWQRQWVLASEDVAQKTIDTFYKNVAVEGGLPEPEAGPAEKSERLGPKPFPLYMHFVTSMLATIVPALQSIYEARWEWHPSLKKEGEALQGACKEMPFTLLLYMVQQAILKKTTAIVRGLIAYHEHPYQRPMARDEQVVWQNGSACLRMMAEPDVTKKPVLLIPSLINRAYILDLLPEESLCRFLARQGYVPFLLDWGIPGESERDFSLTDYLEQRLLPACQVIHTIHPAPLSVVGYCMGGIFGLALSQRIALRRLMLLATPWDFHAQTPEKVSLYQSLPQAIAPILAQYDQLPGDVIHALFHALNPEGVLEKFDRFIYWQEESKRTFFVALEDWVNDGVPLAKGVAHEVFNAWFANNGLLQETWGFAGKALSQQSVTVPTLLCFGGRDRIVSVDSARAVLPWLRHREEHLFDVGHTGLIVGDKARQNVWPLINRWLQTPP